MGSERSRTRRAAFTMAMVAAVFVTAPALAQQPTASDRETARALMAEGRDRRDAGELAAALKAFTSADAIMHVPTTGLEVARTQDKMGQLVEARETLLAVLRIQAQPSDPPPFAEARRAAEALDADLAKRIPTLVIDATSEVPGAMTVIVDEQTIPANLVSIPRKLNPGKHVVVAKAGSEEARETITLAPHETKRVSLRVAKKAAPPPAPVETTPEPAGDAPDDRAKNRVPLVTWIGLGVGAAGLVTGSIAGIVSISKTSSLEGCVGDQCPRDQQEEIDSAHTFATVSNIGFGFAIAGAALAAVGWFVLRPRADKPPSTAWITFAPGGVAGAF